MAEYHVGCGIAGIYAGTLKKNGKEWQNKTEVTEEAIAAVRDWLFMEWQCDKSTKGVFLGHERRWTGQIDFRS